MVKSGHFGPWDHYYQCASKLVSVSENVFLKWCKKMKVKRVVKKTYCLYEVLPVLSYGKCKQQHASIEFQNSRKLKLLFFLSYSVAKIKKYFPYPIGKSW